METIPEYGSISSPRERTTGRQTIEAAQHYVNGRDKHDIKGIRKTLESSGGKLSMHSTSCKFLQLPGNRLSKFRS